MERELIEAYKRYYRNQIKQYDWNYCTAFYLDTEFTDSSGNRVRRALPLQQCKKFIHKNILSEIKYRLLVTDQDGKLKRGIPFYAYYIICKQLDDVCYHVHMLLKIPNQYAKHVDNYLSTVTGNEIIFLENRKDVIRMIKYMLQKGNLDLLSDDDRMIPTGYNLNVDRRHFEN